MNNNEIAMMGDGPMMSGSWFNPKTGDAFTVRDTYFEDNNLYIMTTDGRRMNYDMIQSYIQSEKPMSKAEIQQFKQINTASQSQAANDNNIPDEIRALLAEDTAISGFNSSPVQTESKENANYQLQQGISQSVYQAPAKTEPIDEDLLLINRILKRAERPLVNFKIEWNRFPFKQFDMLEMMGVDLEKAIDFFVNQLNINEIKQNISLVLYDYIHNKLSESYCDTLNKPVKTETPILDEQNQETVSEEKCLKATPNKPAKKSTTKKSTVKKTATKKTK